MDMSSDPGGGDPVDGNLPAAPALTRAEAGHRRPEMPRRVRRTVLVLHVATSVGWLGLTFVLLVLGIVGLGTDDVWRYRGMYEAVGVLAGLLLIPIALLSLGTGLLLGLGSRWGLVRHRWVLTKLLINLAIVVGGVLFAGPRFAAAAQRVRDVVGDVVPEVAPVQIQIVTAAGAELALLTIAVALSVFKPWGRTRFGRRG
jgi:hypothetical protein